MASFKWMAFAACAVVVAALLPGVVLGLPDWDGHMGPALAPFYDKVCDDVDCGKGTCKGNISYPFAFTCDCDAGWKRTRLDGDDDFLFLPCVIPNCTLDYSCQAAPPPVSEKEVPQNASAYDACYWAYCGEGTCSKSTTHKFTCDCKSGYANLLNNTAFPCYSQCALGSDCATLGIEVEKASTDGSPATSFLPGKLQWLTLVMISMGMLMWK